MLLSLQSRPLCQKPAVLLTFLRRKPLVPETAGIGTNISVCGLAGFGAWSFNQMSCGLVSYAVLAVGFSWDLQFYSTRNGRNWYLHLCVRIGWFWGLKLQPNELRISVICSISRAALGFCAALVHVLGFLEPFSFTVQCKPHMLTVACKSRWYYFLDFFEE